MREGVPDYVVDELALYRYREKFHLSYQQLMSEPHAAIEQALLIWSLEDDRAKLEEKRRQA